jgi:hypothetical protein
MGKPRLNLAFMGIWRQNLSDNPQIPSNFIQMYGKTRQDVTFAVI